MGLFPLLRNCAVCSRRQSFIHYYYRRLDSQIPTWHRRCLSCYQRSHRTEGDQAGPKVERPPIETPNVERPNVERPNGERPHGKRRKKTRMG